MENPVSVSPAPIQPSSLPPLSPLPSQPGQPTAPSSSNFLAVIIILIIILLAAGALGFFYFQGKLNIPGSQKIKASPAALINPLESAVPSGSVSAVSETGDPAFDQDLQNIDKGLEQMEKDTGAASQGLNDQQIDILQGM